MSILTGAEIARRIDTGDIIIQPFFAERLSTNSYDLTLNSELWAYTGGYFDSRDGRYLPDPESKDPYRIEKIEIGPSGFMLRPDAFYLGVTNERAGSTRKYVPLLEGKSSGARMSLVPHQAGGFGDIGFTGQWVLEITVTAPVLIFADLPICQVFFLTAEGAEQEHLDYATRGRYASQKGIVPSKGLERKYS